MAAIDRFEDIEAWREARSLTHAIYNATRQPSFAKDPGLRDQMQRASVSIMANIAEGFDGGSSQEFARFLDMSIKSANETEHHLLSARDYELISLDDWQRLTAETIEIRKMTYSYRKKVIQSDRGES